MGCGTLSSYAKCVKGKSADEVNIALSDWLKNFPVKVETELPNEASKQWIKLQEEQGNKVLDTSWIQDVGDLGTELSGYLYSMSELYISDRMNSYASFEEIGIHSNMKKYILYRMETWECICLDYSVFGTFMNTILQM